MCIYIGHGNKFKQDPLLPSFHESLGYCIPYSVHCWIACVSKWGYYALQPLITAGQLLLPACQSPRCWSSTWIQKKHHMLVPVVSTGSIESTLKTSVPTICWVLCRSGAAMVVGRLPRRLPLEPQFGTSKSLDLINFLFSGFIKGKTK